MLRKKLYKTITSIVLIFIIKNICLSQTDPSQNSDTAKSAKLFKPIVIVETWATYSKDEVKNETEYSNRSDIHIRRLRFGGKGEVYPGLKYSFSLHYDRVGEDPYAATKGSDNGLGLWNAYITAKVINSSDLLNIHAGYYQAAVSREYNTSPWAVSSFDKSYAVWYLRNFITARGNGIESGIGLGGLKNFGDLLGISYRTAVHKPKKHSSAEYSNPLFSGRLMLSLGDPEQKKYSYMLSGNQWGNRKGITLGLGGSYQGKTDNDLTEEDHIAFKKSVTYGADILINYEGLRIDGEYFRMKRSDIESSSTDFKGKEYHIRIAYSFMTGTHFIEPAFMFAKYDGEGEATLYKYIGDDTTYDFGINWYLNKDKTKLSIHHVKQKGSISPNKGDYTGIALQFKI